MKRRPSRWLPAPAEMSAARAGSDCPRNGGVLWSDIMSINAGFEKIRKGVRHLLPERPAGCFAQKVPDTFLNRARKGD